MRIIVTNIIEHVVDSQVDDVIEMEGACACSKCRSDILALALNSIPPKYVATQEGTAFELYGCYIQQNKVNIYQALLEACHKVKARPRHGTKFITKDAE